MGMNFHRLWPQAVKLMLLVAFCTLSDCYDPLDPNGNITVTIDIHRRTDDGYLARVTLQNYYQYRHVTEPGWKLGWTWTNKEVIWSMRGAFATNGGNCSAYTNPIPHSCTDNPIMVDFSPEVSVANRSENCCRGGLLSARTINPLNSFSSFELEVGNLANGSLGQAPSNLTLMAPGPGYTCSPLLDTDPTIISDNRWGQRQVPAYRTWKSKCTYSSFLANKLPVCCASLSTFYNPTITTCPNCSCGCPEANKRTETCIRPVGFSSQSDDDDDHDIMQCTDHMCPIRVHWHIQNNYRDHWRVKLTISNYIRNRDYSNWNLLVQHPGFSQQTTAYSFNSTVLPTAGFQDGVALFWGIEYYNDELVRSDKNRLGFVTTEILLKKDLDMFTLSNGWGFPRKVYFNGENCEMPLPDTFPALPNGSTTLRSTHSHSLLLFIFLLLTALDMTVLP